tara:strand:+ start:7727 stop:8152 length:426 start_codon:yes stop_codon:yes gene_type:complete
MSAEEDSREFPRRLIESIKRKANGSDLSLGQVIEDLQVRRPPFIKDTTAFEIRDYSNPKILYGYAFCTDLGDHRAFFTYEAGKDGISLLEEEAPQGLRLIAINTDPDPKREVVLHKKEKKDSRTWENIPIQRPRHRYSIHE